MATAAPTPVCRCDFDSHPGWHELLVAAQCWNIGRKIPPMLYSAARDWYQVFMDEQSAMEHAGISGDVIPDVVERCLPGAFTALLVLLMLWEPHDSPPQLAVPAMQLFSAVFRRLRDKAWGPQLPVGGTPDTVQCHADENDASGEARTWAGVLRLGMFERLQYRVARKRVLEERLSTAGEEPWHPREVFEAGLLNENSREDQPGATPSFETRRLPQDEAFCMCMLHGEGAVTLRATLQSYEEGGLLDMAARRFIVFLEPASAQGSADASWGADASEVDCWRRKLAERFSLEILSPPTWDPWPDPFIGKRRPRGGPGAAMERCAAMCDAPHLLLLEDDWELVTRPAELVRHRLRAAMAALSSPASGSNPRLTPPVLGVHLRHKMLFGAPFYELITAAQHNEPPSPYAAWYFSDDPVEERFPDGHWEPPFWDSRGHCDSYRRSWHTALEFQLEAAAAREQEWSSSSGSGSSSSSSSSKITQRTDTLAARVWWCSPEASLLCASTASHRDPFRSLMYSTNPMLYRTSVWRLHLASYAAVLQDLRAMEEAISSSYMWRVEPSFTLALSIGLFRHRRLDRLRMPNVGEDIDAAACIAAAQVRAATTGTNDTALV